MRSFVASLLLSFVFVLVCSAQHTSEADFNFDWKFQLIDGPLDEFQTPLNDSAWRGVRLPHDWSVEASFDENLEGCTGYLPGGVAWYQKHFKSPSSHSTKNTYVLFDGVYNNSKYWLNGKYLGENPYGYSPVYFDITDLLKTDGSENVLTVYVDHSRYADSRWYTGSGIYRNVKLITVDKLHVPIWGTYLTTPEVNNDRAEVELEVKVKNTSSKKANVEVKTLIVSQSGAVVASDEDELSVNAGSINTVDQAFTVSDPLLWDCENPNMYQAITSILKDGEEVDRYVTPFGIRSLRFEVGKGFFLNDEPTFMKGVCIHHDGGLVGSAVPKEVWRRRLEELKKGGVNAIRTSHNPFSQEFLDLCDEMGLLVQNEIFDELDYPKDKRQNYHDRHDDYITRGYTEHFQEWGKSDLTRTVLRDRNHPCVVQWSIGNEIEWTYLHYRYVTGFWEDPNDPQNSGKYWGSAPIFTPEELKERYEASEKGEYILAETAKRVNGWVKELDPSRITTANLVVPHVSHVSGYADAVDVVGYSYRNMEIPWAKKYFPNKQVTINECPGTWDDWKHVLEYPGVFSMFMWTGIGYIGERHDKWPEKSGWGDMLDIAGFRLQGWNYFKSIWVNEPHLSIGTIPLNESGFEQDEFSGHAVAKDKNAYKWRDSNMHWNYKQGEPVVVEVCSNLPTVELFLNGESLGMRSLNDSPDRLFRWVVPFEEGTLTAKAGFECEEKVEELSTTTTPVGFTLTSDKAALNADGYDVAHLVVQLIDEAGRPVKTENTEITFAIEGAGRSLGVDTGARYNVQDFQSDKISTHNGRCLLIVQSEPEEGFVTVTATSKKLGTQSVSFRVE